MSTTTFNREKLRSLLAELSVLSGMGVSFWHPTNSTCIVNTPNVPSSFCAKLQKCSAMKDACTRCEQNALRKASQEMRSHSYDCHAGLHEVISPVIYNGEILGFIMIGQFLLPDDDGRKLDNVRAWIEENGFDFQEIRELYMELPRIPLERQTALAHIIQALASFVHIEGMVQRVEYSTVRQIEAYIDNHICEPFTLEDVASALNISKSTICHTLQSEKNTSFVKLINKKRVQKVQQELEAGRTVSEAAFAAGFSSASYCSHVFQQITGIRPATYRQQVHPEM